MTSRFKTIADAYHFAAVRHAGQRRKGQAAEPYINHLTEVAQILADAGCEDEDILVAGILHDTVEDTTTTLSDLTVAFGPHVAALVGEVSDDKSLPKAVRKRLQIEHAPSSSTGAKMIKMADKTANLRALVSSPPADWSPTRRADYAEWAKAVVAGCRSANVPLAHSFDVAVDAICNPQTLLPAG